ncbi:hypothetical protein [Actinoplanes sp. NBRC 103695]|nr:hypothetical protein [Actinoplanes sp. NBRC 103695]GLY94050.1 hypothetical protein Acsp02_13060 [Actinoplanes sp. NBRC 103695]
MDTLHLLASVSGVRVPVFVVAGSHPADGVSVAESSSVREGELLMMVPR